MSEWDRFLQALPDGSSLHGLAIHEWRPRLSQQKPGELAHRLVSPAALQTRLDHNRNLLTAAVPHLSWLSMAMSGIPHVVFLTDADGIVLHSSGNDSARMAAFGLMPGYDWSEDAAGRNGAGSALVHNRPVAVMGPEHASSALEDCTCTGAPLHAPDGALIGAIAVNTCVGDGTPERLILVAHTAQVIARELLRARDRQLDQLSDLQHTTIRILSESATFTVAAGRLLTTLCAALHVDWGAIWTVNRAGDALSLVELWHQPDERFGAFDHISREERATADRSLAGRAWSLSGAAWSESLSFDLPAARAAAAIAAGLNGGFAFPIRNGIRVLGVLEFYDRRPIPPNASMITALDTIGSQIGLFLERRQAEAALRESERRYSTLAETVPGVLFSARPDGSLEYVSQYWRDYTGMAAASAMGDGWLDAIHAEDRAAVAEAWQAAVRAGAGFDTQYRLRRRDGSYRWFAARAVAVRDEYGKVQAWYGTALDIEEQKRAETALQAADDRKDQYLAMLAHELRNPLAPIRNALKIIQSQPQESDFAARAQEIAERQMRHMTRLIDDLLDVTRITRGRIRLEVETLDLRDVAAAAVDSTRGALDEREQTLRVSLPEDPVIMRADRVRLEQIITNLLDNASKFTRGRGEIRLSLTSSASHAAITVQDNGRGIDRAALPHLFTLFYQVPGAELTATGGLGIGLTLAQRLAQLHGGSIHASSEGVGRGSQFTVRLPLQAAASAADTSAAPA